MGEVSDTCELTELDRQQVGNGWCEDSSNIDSCGWDGGDCCISTCKTTKCTFGRMCCQTFECINPSINMTAEVMATRQAKIHFKKVYSKTHEEEKPRDEGVDGGIKWDEIEMNSSGCEDQVELDLKINGVSASCGQLKNLCGNAEYATILQASCQRTCEICVYNDDGSLSGLRIHSNQS